MKNVLLQLALDFSAFVTGKVTYLDLLKIIVFFFCVSTKQNLHVTDEYPSNFLLQFVQMNCLLCGELFSAIFAKASQTKSLREL